MLFKAHHFCQGPPLSLPAPDVKNSLRHGSAQQEPGVALFARVSSLYCCNLISDVAHKQTSTLSVGGHTEAPPPPTCCHFNSTAKLTALQRRVDVEGRLLNPGHYTYQVLDEAWHDTTQHGRAPLRGTQHFHLDFVGLCDHWKTMKACQ
jgi:hypothetical protein